MIDIERTVWAAAFGASFGGLDCFLADDDLLHKAKLRAHRAVIALGGSSAKLSADSMMIAAVAEHTRGPT